MNQHEVFKSLLSFIVSGQTEALVKMAVLESDFPFTYVNTDSGATLLHYASWAGDLEAVLLLIEHGVPVVSKDSLGLEPLHWLACGTVNVVVAQELVKAGATLYEPSKINPFELTKDIAFWSWGIGQVWAKRGDDLCELKTHHGIAYMDWISTINDENLCKWAKWQGKKKSIYGKEFTSINREVEISVNINERFIDDVMKSEIVKQKISTHCTNILLEMGQANERR